MAGGTIVGELVNETVVPDGKSATPGSGALWIYDFIAGTNIEMSQQRNLTDPANAVWSPDGEFIAASAKAITPLSATSTTCPSICKMIAND